jgi:hypothetical protein
LAVPIDRARDPLALADRAGFGRGPARTRGRGWRQRADETVGGDLADECLGLPLNPPPTISTCPLGLILTPMMPGNGFCGQFGGGFGGAMFVPDLRPNILRT